MTAMSATAAGDQGRLQRFGSNGPAYLCRETVLEQKCFHKLEQHRKVEKIVTPTRDDPTDYQR